MREIRAAEYFSIGFELAKKEYWTIFFNFLIYLIVGICASITVVGLLVVPAIFASFIKFLLKVARGEAVGVGDSFSEGFKDGLWWKALFFTFLYSVGIVIGTIFFVVPGLYLATAWFLGIYLLVDKSMSPEEALGKSRELVHQLGFWKVFVVYMCLSIAMWIISVIPFLNLIYFFLMPFVMMIYVAIYENSIGNPLTTIHSQARFY